VVILEEADLHRLLSTPSASYTDLRHSTTNGTNGNHGGTNGNHSGTRGNHDGSSRDSASTGIGRDGVHGSQGNNDGSSVDDDRTRNRYDSFNVVVSISDLQLRLESVQRTRTDLGGYQCNMLNR